MFPSVVLTSPCALCINVVFLLKNIISMRCKIESLVDALNIGNEIDVHALLVEPHS